MSKKNVNLRHFDEWSEKIKRFGDDVEFTGVFFKHGKPLYVQRMVGHYSPRWCCFDLTRQAVRFMEC